jgi:hypothetical protein
MPIRTYEILSGVLDAEPRKRLTVNINERFWRVVARQVSDRDQTPGGLS